MTGNADTVCPGTGEYPSAFGHQENTGLGRCKVCRQWCQIDNASRVREHPALNDGGES